jgi:hypothetical protein
MRPLLWLMPLLLQGAATMGPSIAGRQPVLATDGKMVGVVVGRDDGVYFAGSRDGGRTFTEPVRVAQTTHLALGLRRGPRIALTGSAIVITGIDGELGNGKDGDLIAWRSEDGGRTWADGVHVNDVAGSAREGLHDLAAGDNGLLATAWLDLRNKGTRIYSSVSRDNGRTWSANRLVYESPTGSVCQCCHPSVAISAAGEIAVMFRNEIRVAGAAVEAPPLRDMYLARGRRDGAFEPAIKLGTGSWPLAACPMDGGDVGFDRAGNLLTVWRREDRIYSDRPGQPEEQIGTGKNPVLAIAANGSYEAWMEGAGVTVRDAAGQTLGTFAGAHWPVLVTLADGSVLLAYEQDGRAFVRPVEAGATSSARR